MAEPANLSDAERAGEAEAVFREQLARAPESGWTLFGLAASLRAQAREPEAREVAQRFTTAWQRADLRLARAVF